MNIFVLRKHTRAVQSFFVLVAGCCLMTPMTLTGQEATRHGMLPKVRIDTHGQRISDKPRVDAWMEIFEGVSGVTLEGSMRVYSGRIGIEIRGTSSQAWPKKQYGFKTLDEHGEELNIELLDLPREHDWILHAPYADRSAMRNALTYTLARDMGWYASRFHYCELTLNGLYQGVYLLMEKIKRDKYRVGISTLTPEDESGDALSGGYILKFDKLDPHEEGFLGAEDSLGSFLYIHVYPKAKNITPAQRDYIRDYVHGFEELMRSSSASHPQDGYSRYIDVDSFIDFFLLNEVSNNIDGYIRSTFMYKDRDSNGGRLTMGPVWDFNHAYGSAHERGGRFSDGWRIYRQRVPFWWHVLLADSLFVDRLVGRWEELRRNILHEDRLFNWIDSVASIIEVALQRDHSLWRSHDIVVWLDAWKTRSFSEDVHFLKTWLHDRLCWMDEHLHAVGKWRPGPEVDALHRLEVLFPQPAAGAVTAEFSLGMYGNVSLSVLDLFGNTRKRVNAGILGIGQHALHISLASLPAGVYIIRLEVGPDIVDIKKIVLME